MCGVMGYVGQKNCPELVYNGLKRLEYRGYDSAGIAVLSEGKIVVAKAQGKLKELEPLIKELPKKARVGIGHTRWATHGPPITRNAHPHVAGEVAVVHNGIIENYMDLKTGLEAGGVSFETETDTEVVAHLMSREMSVTDTTVQAVLNLIQKLKGAFSLGILVAREPETLYLVKQGSPMVVGIGEGENFFGSDAAALVEHTRKAIFLEDGEFARLTPEGCEFWDFSGQLIEKETSILDWSADSVEKLGYAHYMLKEIHEQPSVVRHVISRFIDIHNGGFKYSAMGLDKIDLHKVESINILACGTAYLAGYVAKYAFESLCGIPVNVELASEFRYRQPCVGHKTLSIFVSQSGETMDTLECAKYAKRLGSQIFSVCNVKQSSIPRESHGTLYMEAGPEIGVASTKAFTAMVLSLYFVASAFSEQKKKFSEDERKTMLASLRDLPSKIEQILNSKARIHAVAESFYDSKNFLYIGRGEHFPIAQEGALKLKEISYIHAEGYAAGELKHGPIALIDKDMPVFALCPKDKYYDKVLSNIEQVTARSGRVIGLISQGDQRARELCEAVVQIPTVETRVLQTILSVVPLQLFSYYVALRRGTDVDQPRNLAKSVTVE